MADKNEPLAWTPKLLAFSKAIELNDWSSILQDLRFAVSCFSSIQNREYGVIFPFGPIPDESYLEGWCKFVAGGIYYRRCFATGVRPRLTLHRIRVALTDEELGLHETLIAIVDKHVAHSVNEMEVGCTNLYVAVDSKGVLHRGGLGSNASNAGAFGPAGYAAIRLLIEKIISDVVEVRLADLRQAVTDTVARMSDQDILELPVGFAPHIQNIKHNRPRSWPGRGS